MTSTLSSSEQPAIADLGAAVPSMAEFLPRCGLAAGHPRSFIRTSRAGRSAEKMNEGKRRVRPAPPTGYTNTERYAHSTEPE